MTEDKTKFVKYLNGIKYILLDDMKNDKPGTILRQDKVDAICEKYILPENKPLNNGGGDLMFLQNDPAYEDFGRYIRTDDFIRRILYQITKDADVQAILDGTFKAMLEDTLLDASSRYAAHAGCTEYDILPMANGYFSKKTGRFMEDAKPEVHTGSAAIAYKQYAADEPVYGMLRQLLEKNPDYAESLFTALSKAANGNRTVASQFYAAVCDSQPYEPCRGCTAKGTDACGRCSRNRYISDMYRN